MAARFETPNWQAFDANGNPLSGAKLNFYITLTSTRLDTFSDHLLAVVNVNPVVADSAGRFGDVFLQGLEYKVVLTDSDDVTIWTADPVHGSTGLIGNVSSTTNLGDANYTILDGDNATLLLISSGDTVARTVTLPDPTAVTLPYTVGVKKIAGAAELRITVGVAGDEIDGVADEILLLANQETAWFVTNGADWFVSSRKWNKLFQEVAAKSAAYTVTEDENGFLFLFTTGASAFDLTLPDADDVADGFTIGVKKVDSGAGSVTLKPLAGDTVDGDAAGLVLSAENASAIIVSNGADWFAVQHDASGTGGGSGDVGGLPTVQIFTYQETIVLDAGTDLELIAVDDVIRSAVAGEGVGIVDAITVASAGVDPTMTITMTVTVSAGTFPDGTTIDIDTRGTVDATVDGTPVAVTHTYTRPAGVASALVELIGGGGGGAGASSDGTRGGGGGGGEYASITIPSIAATVGLTVGKGGLQSVSFQAGSDGGDSTWDTTVGVAKGGDGGLDGEEATETQAPGGVGGTGDVLSPGAPGGSNVTGGALGAYGGASGRAFNPGALAAPIDSVGNFPPLPGYGGGATGGWRATVTSREGAGGASGVVIITQYS